MYEMMSLRGGEIQIQEEHLEQIQDPFSVEFRRLLHGVWSQGMLGMFRMLAAFENWLPSELMLFCGTYGSVVMSRAGQNFLDA